MTESSMFSELTLPNGQTLPNRLCKAAMEENLSEAGQVPGENLATLYGRWSRGGAGLILTGNVMISSEALTGPGGIVLEEGSNLKPFKEWAKAGTAQGNHFWMQINHPGRQMYLAMGDEAVAPSAIPVDIGKYSSLIAPPRALTDHEIEDLIDRFTTTAILAEKAGFTGVQIHAAHGYLINQFLSPLTNQRTDQWGGSPTNRSRFLFETIKSVRASVSPRFCVSVKLNSADFQKGGFQLEDAMEVTMGLDDLGIDLLELSGGNYESPAMYGETDGSSTSKREAYFIDFAREIASVASMPIMVTGGIYRKVTAIDALSKDEAGFNVDVLGIAKAIAHVPDLPNQWKAGTRSDIILQKVNWKNRTLAGVAATAVARRHIVRLSKGAKAGARLSPLVSLILDRFRTKKLTKRYRNWQSQSRS